MLALHSKATDSWGTPPDLVETARRVLGRICIDPCSSAYWNARVVKTDHYVSAEQDALSERISWAIEPGRPTHRTFLINPPGGKVKEFFRFATDRWREGSAIFWVGFSLEQLARLQSLGLFHRDFRRAILPKRVRYLVDPNQAKQGSLALELDPVQGKSPTHSSYVALLPSAPDQVERFDAEMRERGAEVW